MIDSITENTKWQTGLLVTTRILVGWHLLYEGVYKFLAPSWSSVGFLANSSGLFDGVSSWIASNESALSAVDFLNMWGLIAIGLGLILGLLTRTAAISGAVLLGMYYAFNPPFVQAVQTMNMEGHYLIVNKTLIEAVVLLVISAFPSAKSFGLDELLTNRKK